MRCTAHGADRCGVARTHQQRHGDCAKERERERDRGRERDRERERKEKGKEREDTERERETGKKKERKHKERRRSINEVRNAKRRRRPPSGVLYECIIPVFSQGKTTIYTILDKIDPDIDLEGA